jgi:hypothetical protein
MLLGTTLSIGGHGPVIDGHESRWLQGGSGAILAWQYAPGAWTVVQSNSGSATLVRIARAVQYGQHVAVRFASRFTSLPRGWRTSGLRFAREHGVYLASTYAIARLPAIRPTTPVFAPALDEPYISITPAIFASSRCGLDPSAPSRQVTIHGYRFTVQGRGIGDGGVLSVLCSNHVDGLRVSVTETTARGSKGVPPANVMERLQLLGAKPADWVTNPMP